MPAGRPFMYTSAAEMQAAIDKYLIQCEAEDKPLTISGMAYALGMTTETLRCYGQKDDFAHIVQRAKQRVEIALEERLDGAAATGAIFNLKNNFGWKDARETTLSGNVNLTELSDDDIDRKLQQLINAAKD